MKTLELHLDDALYERVCRDARLAGQSPEDWVRHHVEHNSPASPVPDMSAAPPQGASIIGLFADDPDMVDDVLNYIMAAREQRGLAMIRKASELDL